MDELSLSDDWWWIDFLEDELDPMLDNDLVMLLEHSGEDRESFESFRLLKQWLKESDPIEGWPIEARLERMRNNIMLAIEETPVAERPVEKPVVKPLAPKTKQPSRRPLDNSASP